MDLVMQSQNPYGMNFTIFSSVIWVSETAFSALWRPSFSSVNPMRSIHRN